MWLASLGIGRVAGLHKPASLTRQSRRPIMILPNARVRTSTPEMLKFLRVWANYRRMRRTENRVWKCFHKCRNGVFLRLKSSDKFTSWTSISPLRYSLCGSLLFNIWQGLTLHLRWRCCLVRMKVETEQWLGLSHCTSCVLKQIWKTVCWLQG